MVLPDLPQASPPRVHPVPEVLRVDAMSAEQSAENDAEHVLTDRRFFAIADEAWNEFEAALDRPVVFKPSLHALLHEDSPFEPATPEATS